QILMAIRHLRKYVLLQPVHTTGRGYLGRRGLELVVNLLVGAGNCLSCKVLLLYASRRCDQVNGFGCSRAGNGTDGQRASIWEYQRFKAHYVIATRTEIGVGSRRSPTQL